MTEAFLIKKHNDLKQKTLEFTAEILNLELKIKEYKESIKQIKQEAKVDGVAVKEIVRALNIMKKERKTSEQDKREVQEMLEFLEGETSITQMLDELVMKSE